MNENIEPKGSSRVKVLLGLIVVVVLVILGYFLLIKPNGAPAPVVSSNNQPAADEAEVRNLIAAVGKLMVLPEGEVPTVATVADPSKLKDQPFFTLAKTGDKVLIYPGAQKAILWSTSLEKILEVSPLTIAGPNNEATPEPKKTQ